MDTTFKAHGCASGSIRPRVFIKGVKGEGYNRTGSTTIRARALKRVVELTASGRILHGNQRISMLKHGIVFSNPLNATSASLRVERN